MLLTDTILKEKEPEKPAEEAGESGYNIRGLNLLLAEDNDLNAEIAELLLTDAGAKVTIDGDGTADITAAEQMEITASAVAGFISE